MFFKKVVKGMTTEAWPTALQATTGWRLFQLCFPEVWRHYITSLRPAGGFTAWGNCQPPLFTVGQSVFENQKFLKTLPGGPTYTNFFLKQSQCKKFGLNFIFEGVDCNLKLQKTQGETLLSPLQSLEKLEKVLNPPPPPSLLHIMEQVIWVISF